eukprot:6486173-Amphidinium_carterae.1
MGVQMLDGSVSAFPEFTLGMPPPCQFSATTDVWMVQVTHVAPELILVASLASAFAPFRSLRFDGKATGGLACVWPGLLGQEFL